MMNIASIFTDHFLVLSLNRVGYFIFSKFGIKNKKPVINFIDKQMIKSMTGEEERIFSFPENISYFLEMIIQTQTEYFIRTAIYICTFYSGIIITFCSLCIIIIVSPEICNVNTP